MPDILNNKLLLSVFEKSGPALLVEANGQFSVIAVSDTFLQLSGISRNEICGYSINDIFTKDVRNKSSLNILLASFKEIISSKVDLCLPDFAFWLADSSAASPISQVWSITNKPILADDGSVAYIVFSLADITSQRLRVERQKAAEAEANFKLKAAEERLKLAAEATGLGTFDLNLVNRNIIHSSKLAEIFGHPATAVLNHIGFRNQLHAKDLEIVGKAFSDALETGVYSYEARIIWPDQSEHWIRTQGNVMFDQADRPVRLIGAIVDITSQRNVIDELRRSEESLRLATDAGELGTFDRDILNNTVTWRGHTAEFLGLPADSKITLEILFKAIHPEDKQRVHKAINDALSNQLVNDYEVEYRTIGITDKKLRWVRAKGKVFFDANNKPLRFIGTLANITDRKQDEIRKNDFIAMASHELKTPLTSLKAYIQMLLANAKRNNNEFFATSLQKSNSQIDKMTNLIYGFLDLSKIEAGKLQLNRQQFDISDAVDEAITDILPISQGHEIQFHQKSILFVDADREKITQVVINLVNNAIKYSPKGTTIIIAVKDVDDWAEVSVTDQGIGIKQYDLKKIFQRFYRVQDDQTKGYSGFGIGLYLSYEIINLHQGEIGVESKEGEGSTFYFRLKKSM